MIVVAVVVHCCFASVLPLVAVVFSVVLQLVWPVSVCSAVCV